MVTYHFILTDTRLLQIKTLKRKKMQTISSATYLLRPILDLEEHKNFLNHDIFSCHFSFSPYFCDFIWDDLSWGISDEYDSFVVTSWFY